MGVERSNRPKGFDGYDMTGDFLENLREAGLEAAMRAMDVMGFVVTVQDGWVVKIYKDGSIEKIDELKL